MRLALIPEPVLKALGELQKPEGRLKGSKPEVPGAAWAVLAALYLHADPDGICWPGTQAIEDITGYDRSTVIRTVSWLVARGFAQRRKTKGKANHYRLATLATFKTSGVGATSRTERPVASTQQTSGVDAPRPVAWTPPKQKELEQALNKPGPRAAGERGPGDDSQNRPRSFSLPGYGEVYEHDTWALAQPDSRGLYLATFGPREAT